MFEWFRKQEAKYVVARGILFALGALAGFLYAASANPLAYRSIREASSDYSFISPLLYIQIGEEHSFPKYSALKERLSEKVEEAIAAGSAQNVSVYFRNLDTSQWVGVNQEARFAPASMLKVLTLIGALRRAEQEPSLLANHLRLHDIENRFPLEDSIYPIDDPIRSGRVYSIDELLRHMIIYSDNAANFGLIQYIGDDVIEDIYKDLELATPDANGDQGYTPQEYSRIFRTLYNSTYLSRKDSERALDLLSQTTFKNGLVAGVPEGTVVAHKFGVRRLSKDRIAAANGEYSEQELHDCGIVYFPGQPYFLCVMTRGMELENLESVIQDISAATWEEVDRLED
jgi:beta-lactamase class A